VKIIFALAALLGSVTAPAAQEIPSPYGKPENQWAKPPVGEAWGSTAGIERGPRGEIWAIDRCGANSCDGSDHAPIVQLDLATGKPIKSIGAGLFVFPHGLHVDRQGNVWVTDAVANNRIPAGDKRGHIVVKFSPAGQVLRTLGTPGVQGGGPNQFTSPSDVAVADNGDVYVSQLFTGQSSRIPSGTSKVQKFTTFNMPAGLEWT
jgi:hypothetical protein